MPNLSGKEAAFFLFCLAAFIGLLCLGTWQLERAKWKTSRIEYINLQLDLPPISFPINNDDIREMDNEYRLITLRGKFLYQQDIFVGPKYFENVPGFHLITPMILPDNTVVLVNRGWVPTLKIQEEIDTVYRPEGEAQITGMMRKGERGGLFAPDNNPAQGLWYWTDMKTMVERVRSDNPESIIRPILVEVVEEKKMEKYPVLFSKQITIHNDHMQYAFTWFGLAGALLVMYTIYIRSGRHLEK